MTLCDHCQEITLDALDNGCSQSISGTWQDYCSDANKCDLCLVILNELNVNPYQRMELDADNTIVDFVRVWKFERDESKDEILWERDSSGFHRKARPAIPPTGLVKVSFYRKGNIPQHYGPFKSVELELARPPNNAQAESTEHDLTFASMCLNFCRTEHVNNCDRKISSVQERHVPPRLYNIKERRIQVFDSKDVNAKTHNQLPFVALSYVWGKGVRDNIKTTTGNIEKREKEGGLDFVVFDDMQTEMNKPEECVPKVYTRAVEIAKKLDIGYIWVDSLCILQDSAEDQRKHFTNFNGGVGEVYENAEVTLVAMGGDAAYDMMERKVTGLRGCTALLADGKSRITTHCPVLEQEVYYESLSEEDRNQIPTEMLKRYTSGTLPQGVNIARVNRNWYMRGWPFQEHILSRRKLYFTPDQLYFECARLYSERTPTEYPDSIGSQLRHVTETVDRKRAILGNWWYMLSQYSYRTLGHWADRLNAMNTVATQMAYHCSPPLHYISAAGMFEDRLAHHLLWYPDAGQKVKSDYLGLRAGLNGYYKDEAIVHFKAETGDHMPPTWSWGLWKGRIAFLGDPESFDRQGSGAPKAIACITKTNVTIKAFSDSPGKPHLVRTRLAVKPVWVTGLELMELGDHGLDPTGASYASNSASPHWKRIFGLEFTPDRYPKNLSALRTRQGGHHKAGKRVGWALIDDGMAQVRQEVVGLVVYKIVEREQNKKEFRTCLVLLLQNLEYVKDVPLDQRAPWANNGDGLVKIGADHYVRVGLGEVWDVEPTTGPNLIKLV